MIYITRTIQIDEKEVRYKFIRASGPGGQNVNKVASAAQLRFNVAESPSLPDDVRERLTRLAGKQMTADGVLVITARRFRTQEKNRRDALNRLVELIRKAAKRPKTRRKTKPTAASKQRRLQSKRLRSEIKQKRGSINPDE